MNQRQALNVLLAIVLFLVLVYVGSTVLPPAIDWHGAFRPATLALLRGESPYQTEGFMYPPWTSLLLAPLAILPEPVGRALLFLGYLFGVGYTAFKIGGSRISTVLILLSAPAMHGLLNGNIDGLVVLGFVLPPWLGLFLLVIKPQIGIAFILYLFITTLRRDKIEGVVKVFGPVTAAYLLSILIFGLWPLRAGVTIHLSQNASLWPLSLPIGLVLFVTALRKDEPRYSIMASPFMSPYVLFHSWIGSLLGLAPYPLETGAAVLGTWIVVAIQYFT